MEKNIVKGNIMAEYMVLKNNVVEAIYCGEIKNGENIIILPENHEVRVGENIAFYNDDYTRKSDIELILSNLKDIPLGYKLENNQLIEMTYEEQVTAGIKDLPPYYKIENNALVEMAEHEKLELMTKAEKEEYHRQKRDRLISSQMWKIQRHEQEKLLGLNTTLSDDEFLKLLKYIQDLRDITLQEYFPDFVDYPEKI